MVKATHEQPFIGIWLHDNKLSIDEQNKMKLYLNRTFYYYRIFVDTSIFSAYIDKKPVTKIFLIISISDLSLYSLVELAQEQPELFEKTYIYLPEEKYIYLPKKINTSACFNTTDIVDLFVKVSNDINEKIKQFDRTIDELSTKPKPITTHHMDLPSLSVFNSEFKQTTPIRHLTKESFKFVSFLIMRDILIKRSYGKDELKEMCTTCRRLHGTNPIELQNIDYLEKHYEQNEAVQYYTRPWFLFRTINEVCGTESMEEIYKFRKYISDLHSNLHKLNREQKQNANKSCIKQVYRGKRIAGSVLQQLIDNEDGLIGMNGFLSTTDDRDVALIFADYPDNEDTGTKSTLFLLKNHEEVSQPYAHIANNSKVPDESEVLFSLGTMWRIKSITHEENLCTIELTPCKDLDPKLTQLLEKYADENATLISLGDILLEFGEKDEAELLVFYTIKLV
jgi:uncharacterized protein YqfB (UPF0267 family)